MLFVMSKFLELEHIVKCCSNLLFFHQNLFKLYRIAIKRLKRETSDKNLPQSVEFDRHLNSKTLIMYRKCCTSMNVDPYAINKTRHKYDTEKLSIVNWLTVS